MPVKQGQVRGSKIRISPVERQYYRDVYGFDPVTDQIQSNRREKWYCYETWFPLTQDIELHSAGVRVGARVDVDSDGHLQNRIVFQKDKIEARVECTHTIVLAGPAQDAISYVLDKATTNARLTKEERNMIERAGSLVDLPPWGHFAALKSYVAGIVEIGIKNMLRGSSISAIEPSLQEKTANVDGNLLPFGFNTVMQNQIIRALYEIAPASTMDLMANWFVELIESAPLKWLKKRRKTLFSRLQSQEFITYLWNHMPPEWFAANLEKIRELFSDDFFHLIHGLSASDWEVINPTLLQSLKNSLDEGNRIAVALSPNIPLTILEDLLDDPSPRVKRAALDTRELRPELINEKVQKGWQSHKGVYLERGDYEAINTIEKKLGISLRCDNEWHRGEWDTIPNKEHEVWGGFRVLNGRVISLTLSGSREFLIPNEIGNLRALNQLSLGANLRAMVPDELGMLTSLEWLSLARNYFTEVPVFIQKLTNLRVIDLRENRITSLPEWMGSLERLEEIRLSSNLLTTLPESIQNLSIRELDLAKNRISSFPLEISKIISLKWLFLNGNPLGNFPQSVVVLHNLEVLDLSEIKLQELSANFEGLSKLKFLDLHFGDFSDLPESIGTLTSLRELNVMGNNNLQVLPRGLLRCHALKQIDINRQLRQDEVVKELRIQGVRVNTNWERATEGKYHDNKEQNF